MKKIADILEARYVGPISPDTVDGVYELYQTHHKDDGNPKRYARKRYKGRGPSIDTMNKMNNSGPIYAELMFFSNRESKGQPMIPQDEMMDYVKDYVKHFQIPYTSISTRGTKSISVRFEEPDRKVYEASYQTGRPSAREVEEIYHETFDRYKTPDDDMNVPNLRWKGVDIAVWSIGKQGSETAGSMAAFTSFRFDGDVDKEDAVAWTNNFAKKKKVPFTSIEFENGQRAQPEMYVDASCYTAILYEE